MVRMRDDEFPNCEQYASKHLREMKLVGCKPSKDPMEALGNFPNFQRLWVGHGAFVGKVMSIGDEGFPKLEYLELSCLPILEECRVAKGAMKGVSAITINRCPKFIPSTTFLSNLEMELEKPKNDKLMLTFNKSQTQVPTHFKLLICPLHHRPSYNIWHVTTLKLFPQFTMSTSFS